MFMYSLPMSHMSLEEHLQNMLKLSKGEHPLREIFDVAGFVEVDSPTFPHSEKIDYSKIDINVAEDTYD